ncbi:MAG: GIY-YIG nuclease family protein [Nanoarchaeota archaeon]|nr:GIY-YIG nuclease family protein [Nanoarchaeota archaeon]
METYSIYLLKIRYNSGFEKVYVGHTNNIERRLEEHKKKTTRGTRGAKSIELIYKEDGFKTRKEAWNREMELKRLGTKKREQLIFNP